MDERGWFEETHQIKSPLSVLMKVQESSQYSFCDTLTLDYPTSINASSNLFTVLLI